MKTNKQIEMLSAELNALHVLPDKFEAVKDKLSYEEFRLIRQTYNKARLYIEVANNILSAKIETDEDRKRVLHEAIQREIKKLNSYGGVYGN